MARFHISTLRPDGYPHFKAFQEIQILLYYSLVDLGHDVDLSSNSLSQEAINIIFGAHLFPSQVLDQAPSGSIIFNTEQLGSCSPEWAERILGLSQQFAILDYSTTNLLWLNTKVSGRWQLRHERLRLGYHQKLERLVPSPNKSLDFVFFGSTTPYRKPILEKLASSSRIKLNHYFGFYGWLRNSILARSRAALNLHSRQSRILEWPRLLFLVANRIPSVSLIHPDTIYDDSQIEYTYQCRESHAVEDLEVLVDNFSALSQFAEDVYARFREEEQTHYTETAFSSLFPEASPSAQTQQNRQHKRAASRPQELDERWYRLAYPWVDWDPRTIQDYHECIGRYKQYHPNPSYHTQFKKPISLSHLLAADALPSAKHDEFSCSPQDSLKLAVALHFHNSFSAEYFFAEFAPFLASLADFHITTSLQETAELCQALALELGVKNTQIRIIENIGRDIPSKYMTFNEELQNYDLCLFSHGKQSDRAWFHDHNAILAGSEPSVRGILSLFQSRPSLGLLFPDYMPHLTRYIHWSECRPIVDQLLARFGCDTSSISILEFPAGGFFWARPAALTVLHSLGLTPDMLPPEPIAKSGTILHALERMPCLSCEMMGLEWEKLSFRG
jgi:hypothetical protein